MKKFKSVLISSAVALLLIFSSIATVYAISYSWPLGDGGIASLNITNQNNSGATAGNPQRSDWTIVEMYVYRNGTLVATRSDSGTNHSFVYYQSGTTTNIVGYHTVNSSKRIEGLRR